MTSTTVVGLETDEKRLEHPGRVPAGKGLQPVDDDGQKAVESTDFGQQELGVEIFLRHC